MTCSSICGLIPLCVGVWRFTCTSLTGPVQLSSRCGEHAGMVKPVNSLFLLYLGLHVLFVKGCGKCECFPANYPNLTSWGVFHALLYMQVPVKTVMRWQRCRKRKLSLTRIFTFIICNIEGLTQTRLLSFGSDSSVGRALIAPVTRRS